MVEVTCKVCLKNKKTFINLTKKDFSQGWVCDECENQAPQTTLPPQTNSASPEKDLSKIKVEEITKQQLESLGLEVVEQTSIYISNPEGNPLEDGIASEVKTYKEEVLVDKFEEKIKDEETKELEDSSLEKNTAADTAFNTVDLIEKIIQEEGIPEEKQMDEKEKQIEEEFSPGAAFSSVEEMEKATNKPKKKAGRPKGSKNKPKEG